MFPRFLKPSTRGAALAEYGLLAGLVAVVAIGAVSRGGDEVKEVFATTDAVIEMAMKPGPMVFPIVGPSGSKDDTCSGFPEPGTVCSDGSVYAGRSTANQRPIFTTACDAGMTAGEGACTGTRSVLPWNNGNSTGTVLTSATSTASGAENTSALMIADSDSATAGVQPHRAAQYCGDLGTHGQGDWFLPSRDEMHVIYANQTAIRGFSGDAFWTSTDWDATRALVVRFSDRATYASVRNKERPLRCIRMG